MNASNDPIQSLAERLERYNDAYRQGAPLVSDAEYDRLVEDLKEREPDHPFLHAVEPEEFGGKKKGPPPGTHALD